MTNEQAHQARRLTSTHQLPPLYSYAASELFEVPGVLSVFVCGIIFSHFAWHSLAPGTWC